MLYKHAPNSNFEDLSSGRVLFQRPGLPNFPVRLAQEIYLRCLGHLGGKRGVTVYDPCCGGGYLLTAVGFLNPGSAAALIGSDIDPEALGVARRNLSLLTHEGLAERAAHLRELYGKFGKPSHLGAMESAARLAGMLDGGMGMISTSVFQADILGENVLSGRDFKADIVFTDIPYDNLTFWLGGGEHAGGGVKGRLLENLSPVLNPGAVVAICSGKRQREASVGYARLERQTVGKREFEIFGL